MSQFRVKGSAADLIADVTQMTRSEKHCLSLFTAVVVCCEAWKKARVLSRATRFLYEQLHLSPAHVLLLCYPSCALFSCGEGAGPWKS